MVKVKLKFYVVLGKFKVVRCKLFISGPAGGSLHVYS